MIRKSVQRLSTYSHGALAARLDEVAAAVRGLCTKVLAWIGRALVFHSSCILALLYDLVAGESKMDQADWKLRVFYQYQIAKIAKLARERPHPADRKRLNFILDQYIDMLLVMPRPSERAKGVETRMLPTFVKRRRRRGRSPGIQSSPQSNRASGQNLIPAEESARTFIVRDLETRALRSLCPPVVLPRGSVA
jgi:hypothetical protein